MSLEFKQVEKKVGAETHIYATDLVLEPGGFNVLLGTTLAGKTTLLRLMAGLERPSSGEVWFDSQNVTAVPVQKRSVAMVYQQFINYPSFSVFDNIASPLRVAGKPKQEIRQRVEQIADLLSLTPMLQRLPNELSGGQQQRTALARALVKNAALVLLDEPLANLDYKLREQLRDELPKLFADSGTTVVYATSEPLEALLLGGNTAALHKGQISQYGPTAQIYRAPNTLLSAKVFSDPPLNTAGIHKQADLFIFNDSISWPVPQQYSHLTDGDYILGFRPHHLALGKRPQNTVAVQGKVQIAEISGSQSIIHVLVADNSWISESHGVHPYKVGDTTELFIQPERCFYFTSDGHWLGSQG